MRSIICITKYLGSMRVTLSANMILTGAQEVTNSTGILLPETSSNFHYLCALGECSDCGTLRRVVSTHGEGIRH